MGPEPDHALILERGLLAEDLDDPSLVQYLGSIHNCICALRQIYEEAREDRKKISERSRSGLGGPCDEENPRIVVERVLGKMRTFQKLGAALDLGLTKRPADVGGDAVHCKHKILTNEVHNIHTEDF